MCGLIGFVGHDKQTKADNDKIAILLLLNSITRGMDATGIFTPKHGIEKDNEAADDYLFKYGIKSDNILIGHVRAKTSGYNLKSNAHPFKFGNITLAHNGTLKDWEDWMESNKVNKYPKLDVDSESICKVLNEKDDYSILGEIPGAAAVLFYDDRFENTLYAFRNKERPLYYGMREDGLYISSIDKSLTYIGCSDVKEFKENVLYLIIDGQIANTMDIEHKPYIKPVPVTTTYNHTHHGCNSNWDNYYPKATTFNKLIKGDVNNTDYYTIMSKALINLEKSNLKLKNVFDTAVKSCVDIKGNTIAHSLTIDKFYTVISVDYNSNIFTDSDVKSYYINIFDDNHNIVTISPYAFDLRETYLYKNTYAIALANLYADEKSNVETIEKGQVVKIIDYLAHDPESNELLIGYVEVCDSLGWMYNIPRSMLKRVTQDDYNNSKIKDDIIDGYFKAQYPEYCNTLITVEDEDNPFDTDDDTIDDKGLLTGSPIISNSNVEIINNNSSDINEDDDEEEENLVVIDANFITEELDDISTNVSDLYINYGKDLQLMGRKPSFNKALENIRQKITDVIIWVNNPIEDNNEQDNNKKSKNENCHC